MVVKFSRGMKNGVSAVTLFEIGKIGAILGETMLRKMALSRGLVVAFCPPAK